MKQVSQRGGAGSYCTLIVHELVVYIVMKWRLNTKFNLELASFRFIARILIRDRQRTYKKVARFRFKF